LVAVPTIKPWEKLHPGQKLSLFLPEYPQFASRISDRNVSNEPETMPRLVR
jgi:hypothetical protein